MTRTYPRIHNSSLQVVSETYALRLDAKQADFELRDSLKQVTSSDYFMLGDLLPTPISKGTQPAYLDQPKDDSVPVVNTLSIQNLTLNTSHCRHISREDFEALNASKIPRKGDVLLTLDGGVSIGKPLHFDEDDDFGIDSHVSILRPEGISALALVYLLASPLGQKQFRKAESGASGQTSVTEDDIRRFVFPESVLAQIDQLAQSAETKRKNIAKRRRALDEEELRIWDEIALT